MVRGGNDGKKKAKKELTDEEKLAKAELAALQAEETRKKKILARRDNILQTMAAEQKRSTFNMYNIHTEWRQIMRTMKVESLQKSIGELAEKYDHEVNAKQGVIDRLATHMREADDQYKFAADDHAHTLSTLIDLHHTRVQIMDEDFQTKLHAVQEEFSKEREYIDETHEKNKKELKDMMAAMEAEFQKALSEQRQDFESMREELKNKSTEEYNVAKISLENAVEDLEVSIQETHQTYLSSTEAKSNSFKQMVKKDTLMARLIEQRMKKLIKLHELLAYWRARIATNTKEWESANKALRNEKDRINKHYQDLKRSLNRMHISEHEKLKAISKASGESVLELSNHLEMAKKLLKMGDLNKRLETEYERIFTYHPFNCSAFSTTDRKEEDDNSQNLLLLPLKTFRESAFLHSEIAPANSSLVPKEEQDEDKERKTSYAIDEAGNEVTELRYFDNLNKRFNKVMLEKMAINLERKHLLEVNRQLQKRLEHYLDRSPATKHKLKSSSLV